MNQMWKKIINLKKNSNKDGLINFLTKMNMEILKCRHIAKITRKYYFALAGTRMKEEE